MKKVRRRNVSRRLIGLVGLGVLLVLAELLHVLAPVTGVIGVVGRPVERLFSGAGNTTSQWFTAIGEAGSLGAQNQRLKAQVAALQQQISQQAEIKAQNDQLRSQLGVGPVPSDRLLAAEVISYQPDNFRAFLTIARGSKDGVKAGMAVVEQGALVGTIQGVTGSTAKVFLITDPNFRVAALDQDQPDRPTGTIHGQIGGGLQMTEIAQNEALKTGDTVVTSGLGGALEAGLIIGHIQSLNKEDNGVFQSAQVTSPIEFNRLGIVYAVVRPQ